MDQCHICMCHRTVAWASSVTYVPVYAIGLRELKPPGVYLASLEITPKLPRRIGNNTASLKASSGETHTGREESAWLGNGYYYAQMLTSYVVILYLQTFWH